MTDDLTFQDLSDAYKGVEDCDSTQGWRELEESARKLAEMGIYPRW